MSAATKWILAIVGLLVGNIVAMVILATVASATSPGIVPDYYERAAHYDDAIDQAARNRELGWSAGAALSRDRIEVTVRDANAKPLDGAIVRVSGYARAHAERPIEVALVAVGQGTYRAAPPAPAVGIHDLTITVERGTDRFTMPVTVSTEAP